MSADRVVVVGAGIAGLTSALLLAQRGLQVTVVDAASEPGGKIRRVMVDDAPIDSGPTVFTMKWIFDGILDAVGSQAKDLQRGVTARDRDRLDQYFTSVRDLEQRYHVRYYLVGNHTRLADGESLRAVAAEDASSRLGQAVREVLEALCRHAGTGSRDRAGGRLQPRSLEGDRRGSRPDCG